MSSIIQLAVYPFQKLMVVLQNIQMGGISLYEFIAGGLILALVFSLFFSSISGLSHSPRSGSRSSSKETSSKSSNKE